MPNQLDGNGLQVNTVSEIIANLIAGFQAIYGADANLDQNSPDGQWLNALAQAMVDQLELLVQVNESFDPTAAFGILLDERVAWNGVFRKAGTYTITPVTVTVDRALTLLGLDALIANPSAQVFTVQDDAGNQFFLQNTHAFSGAGDTSLNFRAANLGKVQTTLNTITVISTVTLGVTGVNNPLAATTVGDDEETDVSIKLRHSQSFNLAAVGPADAVRAAILATVAVADCFIAENVTGSTVSGVPAHSVWIIVDGGADADVGLAIYSKKMPGCGMKGSVTVNVPRPDGSTYAAKFDRPIQENLYVQFTITPRKAGVVFDTDVLKAALVSALVFKIAGQADIGQVVVAMLAIAPDGILSAVGVSSDGVTYVDILQTSDFQHKFVLSTARIAITT